MAEQNDWICVYKGNQSHIIEIIRAALEEQEIEVFVIDKRDSSYNFGDIEIYVFSTDVILSKIIIEQLDL